MRPMIVCLTLFLTACQNNPVVVERIVEVYPPAAYLEDCRIEYPDRTEHGAIKALAAGVECERTGKKATRCWIATRKGEKGSPECLKSEKSPLPCDNNHITGGGENVGGSTSSGDGACNPGASASNYDGNSSQKVKGQT